MNFRKSFTLIELLVVLAIVAILSTVVIMTLNPAELLKQARDSTRLSDLSTLNTALAAYSADVTNGFMGTSSVVYVSIPDTSPTCANLGLPALPTSTIVYTYNCVPATSTRLTNGQGWIPVNLSNISFGSPLSSLPIDPINTTTSGQYYTYVSGGSFILTAIPESTKQKTTLSANPNIPNYPGVIAVGNNTSLFPLYNPSGLVGYWKFDEGSGTAVADSSGNGKSGLFLNSPVWAPRTRCVLSSCLEFDNVNSGVDIPSFNFASTTDYTMSAWVNPKGTHKNYTGVIISSGDWNANHWAFGLNQGNSQVVSRRPDGVTNSSAMNYNFSLNTWYLVSLTRLGTLVTYYVNGSYLGSGTMSSSGLVSSATDMAIGRETYASGYFDFNGLIDDVRLYNRAFSASEISALYNATK